MKHFLKSGVIIWRRTGGRDNYQRVVFILKGNTIITIIIVHLFLRRGGEDLHFIWSSFY